MHSFDHRFLPKRTKNKHEDKEDERGMPRDTQQRPFVKALEAQNVRS